MTGIEHKPIMVVNGLFAFTNKLTFVLFNKSELVAQILFMVNPGIRTF